MQRRTFLTGALAAAAAPGLALAGDKTVLMPAGDPFAAANGDPLFTSGVLTGNRVARAFATTPALAQPLDAVLQGQDGASHLMSELTGKVRLVSIWAERFRPCLEELNELAELQQLHGDDRFECLAILTQSPGRLDVAAARALMDSIDAQPIPLWVEPAGGDRVAKAYAMMAAPYPMDLGSLRAGTLSTIMPCTLLVDTDGVVVGRTLGSLFASDQVTTHTRWKTPLHLDPAFGAHGSTTRHPTAWSDSDADAFIAALKDGALTSLRKPA